MPSKIKFALLLFSIAIILILCAGCTTTPEQYSDVKGRNGQLSIFLSGPDTVTKDISFHLMAVTIVSDIGRAFEVMTSPRTFESMSITGHQILLAQTSIPAGKYTGLRLLISDARITKKGRIASLALPNEVVEIPVSVEVNDRENVSIFLTWDADASVIDQYLFAPRFTLRKKTPELASLLIYVTNELSNNVSVINRHTATVVSQIMVGDRPMGIASSFSRDRSRIYVVNAGSNSISVIDPSTNKVEIEIPVRYGRKPVDITVAEISPGEELIFVANSRTDSVSVIDPVTYQELEKVDVGRSPVAIAADPPLSELIGTRFLSFDDLSTLRSFRTKFLNVYVANKNSNSVSVIRMDIRNRKVDNVATIDVDWSPEAISIDYPRGKVYVANHESSKITVIELIELVKGNISGASGFINNIGHSISDIIADPSFNRLYVLQEEPGRIIVLKPFVSSIGNLNNISPPVLNSIRVGKAPRTFAIDPENRLIYVLNRGDGNISVIDKTSYRIINEIPVGKMPYDLVLFGR